jgi:hypothetical protein
LRNSVKSFISTKLWVRGHNRRAPEDYSGAGASRRESCRKKIRAGQLPRLHIPSNSEHSGRPAGATVKPNACTNATIVPPRSSSACAFLDCGKKLLNLSLQLQKVQLQN